MCGLLVLEKLESKERALEALEKLHHRGPDSTDYLITPKESFFGFKRLAIMGPDSKGNQPFTLAGEGGEFNTIVCNGEIYNHLELRKKIEDHEFKSGSDCEVLLPLIQKFGLKETLDLLDGEYAFVGFDSKSGETFAARDPMGIRPLFYGETSSGSLAFASEAKALREFCTTIKPFPPGHYYIKKEWRLFSDLSGKWGSEEIAPLYLKDEESVLEGIHTRLSDAVIKRLDSDVPLGFLLSGGLDSSLVCAIAAKHLKERGKGPIITFAIGMESDAIDLKYAKQVADYIGSIHHEVIITKEDAIEHLDQLIYQLETWDITTIRASVGMSLLCRYIREKTPVRAILTGEVSDELFGYKYTDFAPSPEEFQAEAQKRVHELYLYDVLRADRCLAAHGLEARVPFSDKNFVSFVMSIDPALKMNFSSHGKYLLRKAFEKGNYLPDSILWREKAAFSDAVGHSLVDSLKEYAHSLYSPEELAAECLKYEYARPISVESLLYRQIFEKHFSGLAKLIPNYWMPNSSWPNCRVDDPSARVLANYGKSGS